MNDDIQRDIQDFAIAQALYKHFAEQVRTGEPDNLRGRVDDILRDMNKRGGADRMRLTVSGSNVGTLTLRQGKEATRLIVEDELAFVDWMFTDGIEYLYKFLHTPKGRTLVDYMATAIITDGDVPRGCTAYTEPAHFEGTVVKDCDIDKVMQALGLPLPQAVAYALGDGEVE